LAKNSVSEQAIRIIPGGAAAGKPCRRRGSTLRRHGVTSRQTTESGPVMSFLRALFGRRPAAKTEKVADPVEYNGFVIRAAPFQNNGHYQTAGTIEREVGGVRKEHRFIRADVYASYDDAVNFTLNKARQIIDLQGERIFE
jgi:hypothetical protein